MTDDRRRARRGYGFVVAAFVAALVAAGVVAFAPLATTVTETPAAPGEDEPRLAEPTPETPAGERTSLVQTQGWAVVGAVMGPVLVAAGLPLVARSGRWALSLRALSTALLLAAVVLGIFSVGVFVLPVAVLMLVATIRGLRRD